MNYPAAPRYKPTTEQMLNLWTSSLTYSNAVERIEAEVGFYEWLGEQ